MAKLNAAIKFDGKWFVARCLDLPVTSQGETLEEAKSNLAEAIKLYIETWGADELESSVGDPELVKAESPYEPPAGCLRPLANRRADAPRSRTRDAA